MSRGCILVTGGAGYIGTHTLVELLQDGYSAVVVDNLNNSSEKSLKVVEELTGHALPFYQLDLLDIQALRNVFIAHKFSAVIHFAGLKAVGESMQKPFWYYQNNLVGTINLIQCLREFNVKNIVFSSSCTVYGNSEYLPIDEQHPTGGCTNPYGRTKYFIEQIFTDICEAEKDWNVILLRYFNPVGAHPSGRLGEDPNGIPNQLMPYVAQTAVGRRKKLNVFGGDYNTKDGTGVRDYIHVVDLAKGHLKAIDKTQDCCGLKVYNLGTGTGYSVMEMINAFQKASGRKIPYEVVARRPGDAEEVYADPTLAQNELNWSCDLGLKDMCQDLWRWQSKNPDGYGIGTADCKAATTANGITGSTNGSTTHHEHQNGTTSNGEFHNASLQNGTIQKNGHVELSEVHHNGVDPTTETETTVIKNGTRHVKRQDVFYLKGQGGNGCVLNGMIASNGHVLENGIGVQSNAALHSDHLIQNIYSENNNNAMKVIKQMS